MDRARPGGDAETGMFSFYLVLNTLCMPTVEEERDTIYRHSNNPAQQNTRAFVRQLLARLLALSFALRNTETLGLSFA